MMLYLKQNTAKTIKMGPFLDSTDGDTEEVALSIAQADIRLSKGGAAFAQTNNVAGATHDEKGYYGVPLDTTDTNTLGSLKVAIHESGALPVWHEYLVIPANVYDSMFSTDKLEVDINQIGGVAQSATDLKDFADAGYDPATHRTQALIKAMDSGVLTAAAIAADAITAAKIAANAIGASEFAQAAADKIRASVCVTGDPANSVGKALYEIYTNRITSTRAGYLDNLSAGAVALASGVDITKIHGVALTETVNGYLAAAFIKLFDVSTPLLVASDVMRGTDSANTTTPPTVGEIADQVWDELLTGASHSVATSAGRRLREVGAYAIHSGTAQAGSGTTITLAATANGGDGIFNRNLIVIVDGTGVGQTRTIADYNNTTKVCVIDREWRINPDNTSEYQIMADDTPLIVDHGVAQGGTSTTITLRDYASAINDTYLCNIVIIIGGMGRGQARLVGAYNGTTKVATICGDNWVTTPDATSVYTMIPYGTTCASCMGANALAQINTEIDTALTDYDPSTRTEATADKDAIITEVNANETKIDTVDVVVDAIKAKTDNLPSGIQKNVALSNFTFLMTDTSDDPKTGLTVTIQLSKDGGAFGNSSNSVTEITNGYYKINLTQAEMNADVIGFKATAAGANQTSLVVVTS